MSFFNYLSADWTCPFCKTRQSGHITFQYGFCDQQLYGLGDRIDFEEIEGGGGERHGKRLPKGSGMIQGVARCKNNWYGKWMARAASAAKQGDVDFVVPLQVRKKLGCPNQLAVNIELVNDVITRCFFSEDPTKVIREEW